VIDGKITTYHKGMADQRNGADTENRAKQKISRNSRFRFEER